MNRASDQVQANVQDRGAAIAPLEMRRERLHQPPEHERQRLGTLNGPLEIERLLESFLRYRRDERLPVLATRDTLPLDTRLPEPCSHFVRRQRGKLAERS